MEERSFGFWLRRCRKALDLTQDDLARLIGCSKESIRKIEANKQRPSRQIAERLAQQLGVPPDEQAAFITCARSERAYTSLGASSPPPASAPWQTPSHQPRSNLPISSTPLIGRDETIAAVRDRLLREDVRLLTLSGAPGIGKTRLGMQVATELAPTFDDGVYFVDLAPVRDPNMVADVIAQTLGLRETGSQALWEGLQHYLRNRHTLLLLDNFEHLLSAAPLVAKLLAACARLKLLVTSRALLRLSAEHEFVVPPLALPDLGALPPAGVLGQYAAVDLLVRRTQAHKPDFTLTEANAATVAEICVRLDGLPLAIELAAARGKLFAPQALLARLTSRLGLLTGGAHDLPARQQTLRSTIDWSYDLLDASEQALFRRLGAFVGGCTLEAAEAICGGSGLAIEHGRREVAVGFSVLDGLTALVDRSLLRQVEAAGGEPRFMMLETIREYALEQLATCEELNAVRQQHAHFFLALAEEAEPKLHGPDQLAWLERLEHDHDNLRAALAWALEQGQTAVGLRLAGALAAFWEVRGYFSEGRAWLERLLERATERTTARAKALQGLGFFVHRQKDHSAARTCYAESLVIYRQLSDKKGVAEVLSRLGELAHEQSDLTTARALFEESLELYRELKDKAGIARALNGLGVVARDTEDNAAARAFVEEALALYRELGDQHGVAWLLYRFGIVALRQGDNALERTCYEESLAIRRRLGDKLGVAYVLNNLGNLALNEKDYTGAQAHYADSLTLYQELGDKQGIAMEYSNLGEMARIRGDDEQATVYYEASLALYQEIADKWSIALVLHNLGHVLHHRGDYQRATTLFQESLALYQVVGDRFGVALCLAGLAGVTGTHGHLERAARLFGAAEGLFAAKGRSMYASDRIEYDRNVAMVCAQLDRAAFESMWAEGRTLPLEQIVAYALNGD